MIKRKTVQSWVREISPVSIHGEVYGEKDLKCKREAVIDGDRGGDDSVDPTCVG